jgi:hypothetical protein
LQGQLVASFWPAARGAHGVHAGHELAVGAQHVDGAAPMRVISFMLTAT